MRPFEFYIFISFFGLHFSHQVTETAAVAPEKPQDLQDLMKIKAITSPRQSLFSSLTNPRKPLIQKPIVIQKPNVMQKPIAMQKANIMQQGKQIQRRDVPFQQTFLGVPVQIENVKHSPEVPVGNLYPQLPKLPPVKPLIKPNETEAERAERIHKSFDRLLTFVEIVGQVDNYVSSKWKNLVKTVSNFYETEDEAQRVSSKRLYAPCPHAH